MSITKYGNFFIDDYHFSNITKINLNFVPNDIGENIKTCNFKKIGHILCIENKIIKDLMNAFLNWHWIYKDSMST